jgi:glutamyl-tRNA synthetase
MEKSIRKFALENAVTFNGKANPGSIIGKLLAEDPLRKAKMKEIAPMVNKILKEVNSLNLEKQKEELKKLDPNRDKKLKELKEKRKAESKELPELKNAVMGKVVTRIPPEPSKYPHIGHALSFLINYLYAQKYKGKVVLRYEDTNPEKGKEEYVKAVKDDVLDYLGIKVDKSIFVSDHMDKYYEMALDLIKRDKAYTCSCTSEMISKMRRSMTDCPCVKKTKEVVLKEWKSMVAGKIDEGKLTLRLRISMEHKNAVMRDPVIFRISKTKHYRQGEKYKVWPMYDFENAIEEGLLGITHVLRSNEFESRIELQDHIRDLFKLPNPTVRQYARFNITGATTKGREIREKIESGDYIGWDDPRLVTLRALRRRGIVKEALYELSTVVGLSKSSSNLDFEVIASINRKLLDKKAQRFFFIEDPVDLVVEGYEEKNVELDLHPEVEKGGRKFSVTNEFLVEKKDFKKFDNKMIRLMDCLNFVKDGKKFLFKSLDYQDFKKEGKQIIHWLPFGECEQVEIRMPDNTIKKGIGEKNISKLKVGAVIQFERFGFCRLDKISKGKYEFWFSHD